MGFNEIAFGVGVGTLVFLMYQAINLNQQLQLSKDIEIWQRTINIISKFSTPEFIKNRLVVEKVVSNFNRQQMVEINENNSDVRIAVESVFFYYETLSDLYNQNLVHKKFVRMRLGDSSLRIYGHLENYINENRKLTYDDIDPQIPTSIREKVPLENFALSWELMNVDMVNNLERYKDILYILEKNI